VGQRIDIDHRWWMGNICGQHDKRKWWMGRKFNKRWMGKFQHFNWRLGKQCIDSE
jgi:hypothetical protein